MEAASFGLVTVARRMVEHAEVSGTGSVMVVDHEKEEAAYRHMECSLVDTSSVCGWDCVAGRFQKK